MDDLKSAKELVRMVADECGCLPGQNCVGEPDEDAVGWTKNDAGDPVPLPMTFGHIRRAMADLGI